MELDKNKIGLYLKDILTESRKFIDADEMMIVSSALSMMSVVLGNRVHTYNGTMGELYPNLWMLIIAQSGFGSKSSTIKTLNKMILHSILEDNQSTFNNKMEDYKTLSKKEKLEVEQPRIRQILSGQGSTFQGIIKSLENNPNGLLAIYDEARELLKKLNKDTENKAGLTSLYDQDFYGKDLVGAQGTGNSIFIKRPFLSILAVTNPDWLQEEIQKSDYTSGFFNRFSIIDIKNLPRLQAFKTRIKQDFSKFQNCSLSIYTTLNEKFTIDNPLIVDTTEIEELYSNWFDGQINKYEDEDSHYQSFAIRQMVASLKYALIIQIYDYAYENKDITKITKIDIEYMKIGIYFAEYFMEHIENHIETLNFEDNEDEKLDSYDILDQMSNKVEIYLSKRLDEPQTRSNMCNNIRGLNAKNFDEILSDAVKKFPYIKVVKPVTGKKYYSYEVDPYAKKEYLEDPYEYIHKYGCYDDEDDF